MSLAFSPDSKGLITQGGAPDWMLVYWVWEKAKVGAVAKTTNANNNAIFQCSFNPIDPTVICVTGDGICRFLRITEQTLKPLPGAMGKREPQMYLCHAWMSEERVVVATDTGELLLLDAGELKAVLAAAPADGNSIDSIVAYTKGFVCGADGGVIYVFEKSDDKDYYKKSKSFKIENNGVKILNLAVSPCAASPSPPPLLPPPTRFPARGRCKRQAVGSRSSEDTNILRHLSRPGCKPTLPSSQTALLRMHLSTVVRRSPTGPRSSSCALWLTPRRTYSPYPTRTYSRLMR